MVILFATGVLGSKVVPVYQGMVISAAEDTTSDADTAAKAAASYGYHGDYYGKNGDINQSDPYGTGGAGIQDEVQSTLTVAGAGEDIYYADAGDDIYINVKFYNPDYFVILSFVLTYGDENVYFANYNFLEDSDFENIIIKLNVGDTPGIIDYTITEIKYVDGNAIKDVTMNGDTVVSCGVRASSDMVTAVISNEEVTLTSISFTANISDIYSLIEYSGGTIEAILYDGESIMSTQNLSLGKNTVTFMGLSADTLYQYAVVAYYDDLSGAGAAVNYLYTNAVYTAAVVLFDSIEVGQEGIAFDYNWYDDYTNSTITKLTLTANGETCELSDASALTLSGLYSDTEYTLTAYYIGTNGETTSINLTFTTLAKATPAVEIVLTDSTEDCLTFNVTYTDTDGVGEITAIVLYNGDSPVESITDLTPSQFTFTGLSSYTQYTLKVTCRYDLNNGEGEQEFITELAQYTSPVVAFTSFTLESDYTVAEGGSIIFKVAAQNPDGVTFNSVVINDVTYSVSSSSTSGTTTTFYVVIVHEDQFSGGVNDFTITQLNYSKGGNTFSIAVTQDNTASVYIKASLKNFYVEDFAVVKLVDGQYEEFGDYVFPGAQLYYRVTLLNESCYTIDSVTIGGNVYEDGNIVVSDDCQTLYIAIEYSADNCGWMGGTLTEISYSSTDNSATKETELTASYLLLSDNEVVEISTAEQLQNLTAEYNESTESYVYKYYKLTSDINLSGYTWANIGNSMYGVFDGNGHTISNIIVTGNYAKKVDLGLFGRATGVVCNLTVTGMQCVVTVTDAAKSGRIVGGQTSSEDNTDSEYDTNIGIISAGGSDIVVNNCTLDATFSVTRTATQGTVYVGCVSATNRSITVNDSTINITAVLPEDSYELKEATISNSTVNYTVSVVGYNEESGTEETITYYYIGDYVFAYEDGVYTLTSYTGSDTDITLPESINGNSYVIGNNAFDSNTYLKNVTILNGVTEIGSNAFAYCISLESVTLPDSITIIESSLFEGCASLVSVNIPESVTKIDIFAFYGCSSLESIIIPASVMSIENSAFSGCSSLVSVTFLGGTIAIYTDAFSYCTSLETIIIPELTGAGGSIFDGCTSLTAIYCCSEDGIMIFIENTTAMVYAYSEEYPTDPDDRYGGYWHYVDGVPTVW